MVDYVQWPEAKVVRRIRLGPSHQSTDRTRHYAGGQLLPPPAELVIARYDAVRNSVSEDPAPSSVYYLFYLDAAGAEMTDLMPGSLEEALRQAEWEFQIKPDKWEVVG